jgi:muconolactone delta-isomerase
VEGVLAELTGAIEASQIPSWLQPALTHLVTVLRRLGDGLYHCYDVPGLPRTNNELEQFYRRIKAGERRITGHRRSDTFVVRVGGFAVYALAATDRSESELQRHLATVPASSWRHERTILQANQERQVKMRRFHLHRSAYLADLEARWIQLSQPP